MYGKVPYGHARVYTYLIGHNGVISSLLTYLPTYLRYLTIEVRCRPGQRLNSLERAHR